MPRKAIAISRAPHSGKVYFSLNLKLWQTVLAILVSLTILLGAFRAMVLSIVNSAAAEVVKAELAHDEWRALIEAQLKGLRAANAEQKDAIARLQASDLSILETIAKK
jgi:Mg2+/Co2+ transporter CorB